MVGGDNVHREKRKKQGLALGPGGYTLEFLVGMCRPHLQIQTQFQTKNAISHTRFQTWLQKSIPVFRPDLVRD